MQPFGLAQKGGDLRRSVTDSELDGGRPSTAAPISVDGFQELALLLQVFVQVIQQLLVLFLNLAVKLLLMGHKGFQAVGDAFHGVVVEA